MPFLGSLVAANASPGNGTRYLDELFSSVAVTRDIVYRKGGVSPGGLPALLLDLREPTGDTAPTRPAIVWIHGGGFYMGSKEDSNMEALADRFARRGYVTVSINYRLAPRDTVDPGRPAYSRAALVRAVADATEDARAAVRWLRENAARLRIATQQIAIGGGSAGAFTSLKLAYTRDEEDARGGAGSSEVRAVVGFWGGLLDVNDMQSGGPPLLVIHGTLDKTVPFGFAERLVRRAQVVGVTCEFHPLEGAGHAAWASMDQYVRWFAPFLYRHVVERQ